MLRIKDPKVTLDFYTRVLGMRLYTKLDFPEMKFTLYFLGTEAKEKIPESAEERKAWTFSQPGVLEFTQLVASYLMSHIS